MTANKEKSQRRLLSLIGQQEAAAQALLNACKQLSRIAVEKCPEETSMRAHVAVIRVLRKQQAELDAQLDEAIVDLSIHTK